MMGVEKREIRIWHVVCDVCVFGVGCMCKESHGKCTEVVRQPSFYLSRRAELLHCTSGYMEGLAVSDHSPPPLNLPLPIVIAPLLLTFCLQ